LARKKGRRRNKSGNWTKPWRATPNTVERHLGRTFQHHPGAGAAGGLGFAFLCLGGHIQSGARLIIEVSGLAGQLPHADWLITGEGRTDEQTLLGKLPVTLADMARAHGVRTILVSGSLTGDEQTLEKLYRRFDAVFAIPNRPMSLEEAMRDVRPLLKSSGPEHRPVDRRIGPMTTTSKSPVGQ